MTSLLCARILPPYSTNLTSPASTSHPIPTYSSIKADKRLLDLAPWPSIVRFYDVSNQTSGALKHLEQKHNLTKAGLKVVPAKRRNPFEIAQRVEQARNETINPDEWQARFINIRKLIQVSVEQARPQVVQKLHMARSRISFSFDAWSSRSHLPFLGIYAHFIDEDYRLATCLLALKYLEGRHTGERLGTVLFEVLTTYDLTGKIGWFVADNASSNDTTLRKLSQLTQLELPEQRLRCLGHVLNLACQAMLHGTNADDFEHIDIENIDLEAIDRTASKFINQLSSLSDEELLDMWRRKGFYGKAHNFVVYVNRSPQRIQAFKAKQRELDESTTFLYSLLADGGVRWNSAYAMFERHIKLKDAVTAFQNDQRDAGELDEEDYLTPENWREMVEFKELLEPFKEATMRTQGQAKDGTHGALWEWLTELELLMEILENKKTQLLKQPPSFLRTCVNLAWSKLDNYYRLSDDTFAYRLAIVLNPNFRYDWFEEHWGKRAPHEIRNLAMALASYLAMRNPTRSRRGRRSRLNVLAWWKAHQATYPVLSQMAFDVLAIPAMSAEVERLFSSAGLVITKRRARTLPDLAEEAQLLKAWLKERRVTLWPSEAPLTTLATTTVDEILV
ncbi:hypothetical protein KCU89_g55, partial [Aureobasidium melanogenum]